MRSNNSSQQHHHQQSYGGHGSGQGDRHHGDYPSSYDRERHREQRDFRESDRDRDRDRDRERRPKRNRSNSRDRFDDRDRYNDDFDNKNSQDPTATIMIKGLPAHTTEPTLYNALAAFYPKEIRLIAQRDTGECRGFAFVQFHSVEYATYFLRSYAGSAGDRNAPQLIIDMRAVTIEYARDKDTKPLPANGTFKEKDRSRGDWLCECGCQNFSRRNECFRCGKNRTESSVPMSGVGAEQFGDSTISSDKPSSFLVVKGFGMFTTEDQIVELFRLYANVKSVIIVRDIPSGVSLGIALVEFLSPEHASYVLKCAKDNGGIQLDRTFLKINFAKENFVEQQRTANYSLGAMNPYYGANNFSSMIPPPLAPPVIAPPGPPPPSVHNKTSVAGVPGVYASLREKPKWPPFFDTNGAAYVFQKSSGYFLEELSGFYYCPKSKLYYSGHDGNYYHYDAGIEPPFRRYIPPLPKEILMSNIDENSDGKVKLSDIPAGSISENDTKISSFIEGSEKSTGVSGIIGMTLKPLKKAKKAMSDFSKWEAARKEQDENEGLELEKKNSQLGAAGNTTQVPPPPPPPPPLPPSLPSSVDNKSATPISPELRKSIPDTQSSIALDQASKESANASGPPFCCLLCKRQFVSLDQLKRHEKESKLHAENLQKAATSDSASANKTQPIYRDRALERRAIHGYGEPLLRSYEQVNNVSSTPVGEMTPIPPPPPPPPSLSVSAVSSVSSVVSEDHTNPGNQLLRKMGWVEGSGLGKDNQGNEVPVAVMYNGGESSKNSAGNVGSTAGLGASGNGNRPTNSLVRSSDSVGYKRNLLNATRARFEEVSKKES